MGDVIPAAVQRSLADKLYEKRKTAALEIEGIVKQLAIAGDHARIKALINLLTSEFTYSPQTNHRKGGLIGLAAVTVGLAGEAAQHLDEIVPAVLDSFLDQDSRVRYYACEALYNIAKVVRGEFIIFFNKIFDALCKLSADSDANVQSAAHLLDRLVKDIVTVGDQFSIEEFIPLLRERMNVLNPYVRQFLVGWITVLDSVPEIDMLGFLPDFLDGLFNMLSDSSHEIRQQADSALSEFLSEIKSNPNVDFGRMAEILVQRAGSPDEFTRLTSIIWINEFVRLAGDQLVPHYADILGATLPLISDKEEKIRVVARETNEELRAIHADPTEGFDIGDMLSISRRELTSEWEATRIEALHWISVLLSRHRAEVIAYLNDIFDSLLTALSDSSDEYSNILETHDQPKFSHEEKDAYDVATVAEVDRTVKKYADNLLHALEGVSSRLSQLESRTRNLESSVDDFKDTIGTNTGSTDGKLRQLENILREVQTGVQVIRDKQEISEAQLQLAKLQSSSKADHYQPPSESPNTSAGVPDYRNQPHPPLYAPAPPTVAPPQQPPLPAPNAPPPPPPAQQHHPQFPAQLSQAQLPSVPSLPRESTYFPTQGAQPMQPQPQPQSQPPQHPQHYQVQQYSQQMPPPQVMNLSSQLQPPGPHHPEESAPYMPPPPPPSQSYPPPIRQPTPMAQPMPASGPPQYYGSGQLPPPSSYATPSGPSFADSYPYSGSPSHYGSTVKPSPFSNSPPTSGGGSGNISNYSRLPTAKILPQEVPTGTGSSGGSGNRVPVDDVVDKVATMGFSREQVRAAVRKLTENGQSVDLNVVLDKLMNDGGEMIQPQKGWFGR